MEGIGGEVMVVIGIPVLAITSLVVYYWPNLKQFVGDQFRSDVRIEENDQERHRREERINDMICSICLSGPKDLEISSTCGHSFCADCILSLFRGGQQIRCPLCRQPMNLLFRLFDSSDNTLEVERKMREYNQAFDDNRPLLRRVIELPYLLKRLWKNFFTLRFLAFFWSKLHVIRWLMMVICYLLLPLDLIPEQFFGVIGFIDDILFVILLTGYLMTIAALHFHRDNH